MDRDQTKIYFFHITEPYFAKNIKTNIVFQIQLSPFSLHHSPCPTHSHFPHWNLHPWALSMCPLYMFLEGLSPVCPYFLPPPSPLVTVSLFFVSVFLVIFCLLFSSIDYVPVKGEIIWYLSLTAWLISLSIMLSSSIHAVAKGRSSFFLSAA